MTESDQCDFLFSAFVRNETDHRIKVHARYTGGLRCFERQFTVATKESVELLEEICVFRGTEKRCHISEIWVEGLKNNSIKTSIPLCRFLSAPTKQCTFIVRTERTTTPAPNTDTSSTLVSSTQSSPQQAVGSPSRPFIPVLTMLKPKAYIFLFERSPSDPKKS